jgi:hypothetical protein
MKAGAAIAIFALFFLARTVAAEEESYVFGPASFLAMLISTSPSSSRERSQTTCGS